MTAQGMNHSTVQEDLVFQQEACLAKQETSQSTTIQKKGHTKVDIRTDNRSVKVLLGMWEQNHYHLTNCRSLVQKGLDKLENWANRNLKKFEKCEVLLLDLSVSVCHYRLERD